MLLKKRRSRKSMSNVTVTWYSEVINNKKTLFMYLKRLLFSGSLKWKFKFVLLLNFCYVFLFKILRNSAFPTCDVYNLSFINFWLLVNKLNHYHNKKLHNFFFNSKTSLIADLNVNKEQKTSCWINYTALRRFVYSQTFLRS